MNDSQFPIQLASDLSASQKIAHDEAILESVAPKNPMISVEWSGLDKEFLTQRWNYFINILVEEFKAIPQEQCDWDHLRSEEFLDLKLLIAPLVLQTRHREKTALYAKFLIGAIPFQDRSADDPESYIKVVAALSMEELEVAKAVYHVSQTWRRYPEDTDEKRTLVFRLPDDPWDKLGPHCPHVKSEDLPFYLSRLVSAGLIQTYGATTSMNYPGGAEYVIPKTFTKLMKYAKEKWGEES